MIIDYIKVGLKKIRKRSEFILTIAGILIVFKLAPKLFLWFDPQAGEFSIDVLYIPTIAGIFLFLGLWFVWMYLWLVFPNIYRLIDNVFETNKEVKEKTVEVSLWQKLLLSVLIFCVLCLLYAASLLAASGMSGIMLSIV